MHELSIAEALVGEVAAAAERERAVAVSRVVVLLGALSGADPEALRAAFTVAAEGSRAAEAELVIEEVAARVRCRVCGHVWQAEDYASVCAACGGADVDFIAGRELHIKTLEIAVEEERQVERV